jgi:hypothetical protein
VREEIVKSSFLGRLGIKHSPSNPRLN